MELTPRRKPQEIAYKYFEKFIPEKIEMYQNNLFFNETERINTLLLLMQNLSLETMVKNLPIESRIVLGEILKETEKDKDTTTVK